jgi:PD-(D/E)XK nuclease superfamily protein
MPDFCPRCFWIQSHAESLPFQIPFPGIFNTIDAYEKALIDGWFAHHGSAPAWLASLGRIKRSIKPPHYKNFNFRDEAASIVLRGTPDGILEMEGGSFTIFDLKTARFTAAQDHLFPMYEVQLNAYAFIGERCGLNPVSKLALVYLEPVADETAALEESNMTLEGVRLSFRANIRAVEIQPRLVRTLLQEASKILSLSSPPLGREGCEDCLATEELARLSKL